MTSKTLDHLFTFDEMKKMNTDHLMSEPVTSKKPSNPIRINLKDTVSQMSKEFVLDSSDESDFSEDSDEEIGVRLNPRMNY